MGNATPTAADIRWRDAASGQCILECDGKWLSAHEGDLSATVPVDVNEGKPAEFDDTHVAEMTDFASEAGAVPRARVRVLQAGLSNNNRNYPARVLERDHAVFEGAPVLVRSNGQHRDPRDEGDVRDQLGVLENVSYSAESKAIEADMLILRDAHGFRTAMHTAAEAGKPGLIGFSWTGPFTGPMRRVGNKVFHEVEKILGVKSLDAVLRPAAGGQLLSLAAESGDPTIQRASAIYERNLAMRDKMLSALSDDARKALPPEEDPTYEDKLLEAHAAEAAPAPAVEPAAPPPVDIEALLAKHTSAIEARASARAQIEASSLPSTARTRLTKWATEAAIDELGDVGGKIEAETAYIASLGGGPRPQVKAAITEDQVEKTHQAFEAFFDPKLSPGQRPKLRDLYVMTTGDRNVTFQERNCDEAVALSARNYHGYASEAITGVGNIAAFGDVLADELYKQALNAYENAVDFVNWRRYTRIDTVDSFTDQKIVYVGSFGIVPTVNEGADYTVAANPPDTKETYKVTKRGFKAALTREAIKNNDSERLGVFQQWPTMLANDMLATISNSVNGFITTNANLADGTAYFHASHGNLLATAAALSADEAISQMVVMYKQNVPVGTGATAYRMGMFPKVLLIPVDLIASANNFFRRDDNLDRTWLQNEGRMEVVVIPEWTDANDWYLALNPMSRPGIVVGFEDGNQVPRVLANTNPRTGEPFDSDTMQWRVDLAFGVGAADYRALRKCPGA